MDDVDEVGKVLSQGNYGNNTPSKRRAAARRRMFGVGSGGFMRKYHPDAANQRFKITVISEARKERNDLRIFS